uniref:Uncharacterized protein n=1 Tax=viral metagenome TaxID=1070528 RepID=A0A6C0J1I8_9ZZZZ
MDSDAAINNILKFVESDNFINIIATLTDIIVYYAMLVPQLFSGGFLAVLSHGAAGDTISDALFLVLSLIMMGGDFIMLIINSGNFVINVGGAAINMFDEFAKINFNGGMEGLKKQLDDLFDELDKRSGFKNQIEQIFDTVMNLIDTGGNILSDFISMLVPNDSGVIKGVIGTAINALKMAVVAGRNFPSVFDVLVDLYSQIPENMRNLLESTEELEKFMVNIVDSFIFVLGKVKFIGEPTKTMLVDQKAGGIFDFLGFSGETTNDLPGLPGLPDLPDLPDVSAIGKAIGDAMEPLAPPSFSKINKMLSLPVVTVPSMSELKNQMDNMISQNINVEKILNSIVIPAPYELKKLILDILMMLRSMAPGAAELGNKVVPLTMCAIYFVEYAIKT